MVFVNYQNHTSNKLRVILAGRLDTESVCRLWEEIVCVFVKVSPYFLEVDASRIEYCDGAGIGLLLELQRRQQQNKGIIRIIGLKPEFQQMMSLFDPGLLTEPEQGTDGRIGGQVRKAIVDFFLDWRGLIVFAVGVFVKLLNSLLHFRKLRWPDVLRIVRLSGFNAVGIVAMLGFLIGLILTFQSTIEMKKFGSEIFVANLVVLSLFRELGPLITAFILANR